VSFSLVGEPHLDHPAITVRALLTSSGFSIPSRSVPRPRPRWARRCRTPLHRLDDSKARELTHRGALFGKLHEYHIAQLLLREVRDADRGHVAVCAYPLVSFEYWRLSERCSLGLR